MAITPCLDISFRHFDRLANFFLPIQSVKQREAVHFAPVIIALLPYYTGAYQAVFVALFVIEAATLRLVLIHLIFKLYYLSIYP